eukprot:CAMPEP_0201570396 /NCGR_PEP_ID=MMETSP0190_2-20130828/12645_1 /ASSEMBLY_ACC=CAM_ASM_000263 /TAXON_ID=37353 /ORGANISM="Rosalina sp." /LENGTH=82 /DNA_ID=CAMNT_0047993897 /DNA_START=871 /DNA_END=1115 /DNA_ORIENTATION=-
MASTSDPCASELKPTFAESPDPSDNEEWIPDPNNDTPFRPPLALTRSHSESAADLFDDASAQIEDVYVHVQSHSKVNVNVTV